MGDNSPFSFALEDDAMYENANIKVVGVGGAGNNAINNMVRNSLHGVNFIAVNTDQQALAENEAGTTIRIGGQSTGGLGAGANPEKGYHAAMENRTEIAAALQGSDMVFVTAGLGGGTGTGAAPVVAEIARDMGALTVGVVTKPFEFEGRPRARNAMTGLEVLRERVDTLIVIPNDKLLGLADADLTLVDAFKEADSVLFNAVKGISDLITNPGLINVDFNDVRTIMANRGLALMGTGAGTGKDRAVSAARQAISSPLLEDTSIDGACAILINITGGADLTLKETQEASSYVVDAAHPEANVIWGTAIDPTLEDEVRITVVATGFDQPDQRVSEQHMHATEPVKMQAAPPVPPPLQPVSTLEPSYVSVSPQQPAHAQMADSVEAAPKAKPWQGGGRSLSDVLSASQEESGPFVNPANSEYGPQGYTRNGNN
jgi:cell division protein FtsZ